MDCFVVWIKWHVCIRFKICNCRPAIVMPLPSQISFEFRMAVARSLELTLGVGHWKSVKWFWLIKINNLGRRFLWIKYNQTDIKIFGKFLWKWWNSWKTLRSYKNGHGKSWNLKSSEENKPCFTPKKFPGGWRTPGIVGKVELNP